MPIKDAAKKALRQDIRKHAHNVAIKDKIGMLTKKLRKAFDGKNLDEAKTLFVELQKTLDKAGKRRVIHQNKANRLKARLGKRFNVT